MATTTEKVYVPSTFANIKSFDNGGEVINIDFIDSKELIKFITANSADGKFRIVVQKQKKAPSKASVTLNTYVPKGTAAVSAGASGDGDDDLPF